jgi:hypothetical protein
VTQRNLLITMGLGGLWHGAQWTFLAWGLWHGAGLVLHRAWLRLWGRREAPAAPVARVLATGLSVAMTFLFVSLGWVLFRSADFPTAMRMYSALASPPLMGEGWASANAESLAWVAGALAIALFAPNCAQIFASMRLGLWPGSARDAFPETRIRFRPSLPWAIIVAALLVATLLSLSRETVFLYFQF